MGRAKYGFFHIRRACEITGKTASTIRRWAKEGLNLTDDAEIVSWNTRKGNQRKKIDTPTPPGGNAALGTQADAPWQELLDSLPAPNAEGAAAALQRLQQLELLFHSRLLEQLRVNRSDLDAVSVLQRDYDRVASTLRQYEKAVELWRRETGSLVSKQEAIDGCRSCAVMYRLAWRAWLQTYLQEIMTMKDTRLAKDRCEKTFHEIQLLKIGELNKTKFPVPPYAHGIISEEWHLDCEPLNQ
jgi:hypothetical protein